MGARILPAIESAEGRVLRKRSVSGSCQKHFPMLMAVKYPLSPKSLIRCWMTAYGRLDGIVMLLIRRKSVQNRHALSLVFDMMIDVA